MSSLSINAAEVVKEGVHAWVPIRVPSRGHIAFYKDTFPEGRLQIRKMTLHEESILHAQGLSPLDRINMIVSNCMRLPATLPAKNLLTTDRHAILLMQRIFSYGPKYTFTYRCPSCRRDSKSKVDLTIDLHEITPDDITSAMAAQNIMDFQHEDPFTVMLEDAGYKAHVRFARADDEAAILRRVKSLPRRANDPTDPAYVGSLVALLDNMEGIADWVTLPMGTKEMTLRSMTGADRTRITAARDSRETGISSELQVCCELCGNTATIGLPFDAEFFQPTSL